MIKPAQLVVLVLAMGITFSAAILHGRWTNRWETPEALTNASAVLQKLPQKFKSWELKESQELPASVRAILRCENYVQASYVDRDTAQQVTLTLLVGPPGPIAVHTPEVCYSAIDLTPLGPRKRVHLEENTDTDTAWMSQFRDSHDLQSGDVRVYYAWSDGTKWTAADEPRMEFGGRPFLFKVQVMERLAVGTTSDTNDPAKVFLRDFMPEFEQAMTAMRLASKN